MGVGPKAGTPGTYVPAMFETLGMKVTIRNGQGADLVMIDVTMDVKRMVENLANERFALPVITGW